MKTLHLFAGATMLAAAFTLSGCGGSGDEPVSVAPKAEAAQVSQMDAKSGAKQPGSATTRMHPVTGEPLSAEQVLVRGNGSEPGSIDPQLVDDSVGGAVVNDLFEGLTSSGADGQLMPGVAESWSASEDFKTWTFKLRHNAKWSDGEPVTANDFVYSWRRAVNPEVGSNYAYYMEVAGVANSTAIVNGEKPITELGVKALDDYTLQVSLEVPVTYLPIMVSHYTTYPSPQRAVEKYKGDWTKPGNIVSNGAYKLKEWSVGEKMVAVRNEHYWGNANTIINEVVYLPIDDTVAEMQRFEAGEMHHTNTVPVSQMERIKQDMNDELISVPKLATYMYQFNLQEKPFDDVRVRKALSYAIDRDIIVKYITKGGQTPAYSITPPEVNGFHYVAPEISKMTQAERDAEAVRLLNEAGYNKDNPLVFDLVYNTSEGHKSIAVAISQMWKEKLGAIVTPTNMEWKTFLTEKAAGNFKVARYGWNGDYNEASTFLTLMLSNSGNNDGKWSNAEFDKLLADARNSTDPAPFYEKAEQILSEEMPVAPIYFYRGLRMVSPQLGGYATNNPLDIAYAKDMYIKAQ
ncbi:peptide ABC transporter substrate-binding protein [Hahella sp. HN01]|uniref:peptide ABC transporter substrate-binding protein n=1 Tax=unclassified Hahella TaxID=2624107 RepID=UPI001C1EB7FE|nr:peptide ABC transporter substrate-binding protein [Hahella sp. HN01]MBU6953103.1 peptide ABC transporter substrate-binding protein [Hahella sp. HN01]